MTLTERTLVTATALCLVVSACAGTPIEVETEGASSDSGSGTTADAPNPTSPNPTQPMNDTGVMTGDDTTGTVPTGPGPTTGDDTTGGEGNSCCEAHATPGCDQPAVVDCVCALEASCCAFEWGDGCVDVALGDCDATCDEPGTGDSGTSTGPGDACVEVVQFEMSPLEATLSGDWELGMSGLGEGDIAIIQDTMAGSDGAVTYEPDLPCDDTWYIWVRGLDFGNNDSYYATLDGAPMPPAVFEIDCTPGTGNYVWTRLNWRDEAAPSCTYVEDPWAPDWAAGLHQIAFSYREINAVGRILITNDPDFVP